ncbi:aggregation-promoting factor [Lactobacillaceae bacterium Scapto_B20]
MLASTTVAAGLFVAGASVVNANADASTKITVQSGDTLWDLAQHYNVDLTALENANNLQDSSLIYVGQVLNLPENATANTAQQNGATSYSANVYTSAVTTSSYTNTSANATSNNATSAYTTSNNTATATTTTASDNSSAKEWIASRESGGSYTATNGQYVGKYQLSSSYLNGDYSAENQEKVADSYVASRYGSWDAAKAFWQSHGWY